MHDMHPHVIKRLKCKLVFAHCVKYCEQYFEIRYETNSRLTILSLKWFSKSNFFFKRFQKRRYSNLLSKLSLCLCTEGYLCVFLQKKISFTHASFKREGEKLSLKRL